MLKSKYEALRDYEFTMGNGICHGLCTVTSPYVVVFQGTASDDIVAAIKAYKQGHPYRCDRHGHMNIGIGKVSQHQEQGWHSGESTRLLPPMWPRFDSWT